MRHRASFWAQIPPGNGHERARTHYEVSPERLCSQPPGRGCSALSLRAREDTKEGNTRHLHMSNSIPTQALWPQEGKGREDTSTSAGDQRNKYQLGDSSQDGRK